MWRQVNAEVTLTLALGGGLRPHGVHVDGCVLSASTGVFCLQRALALGPRHLKNKGANACVLRVLFFVFTAG